MQNSSDLSHINKQIQQNNAHIADARGQAENNRRMAAQKNDEDNASQAPYYEQEAMRIDQQAEELQKANEQLEEAKKQIEARIKELEDSRTQAETDYAKQLSDIDNELAQLRGSGMML